ncbi:MAG: tRNA pseudouridine(38-40) synthase TruA [Calditrichota bacterium]
MSNLRNLKIVLDYDGTNYHGWQYQIDCISIQQKLEEALFALTGKEKRVAAAGRTDAGVHARGQVASVKLETTLSIHKLLHGLNHHLPDDIAVLNVEDADDDFHARFSATARVYQYYLVSAPNSLRRNYVWYVPQPFDESLLNPLAEKLIGNHDFGAFARNQAQVDHKRCIITESFWRREGDCWIYRVSANRFLHGMVRTIVGTILDTARGRFSIDEFDAILSSKDRKRAGVAAPAKGLVLEEVCY